MKLDLIRPMDHREKLRWARHHLDEFEADVERFSNGHPYQVVVKEDPHPPHYAVYLSKVKPPDPDWSLRIGDVLHCARSAIDSVIYQRSVAHMNRPLMDDELRSVLFPVVMDPKDWKAESGRRLKFVPPSVAAAVERVQPYHRLQKKSPLHHQELALLRNGSNFDKHRMNILTLTAPTGFRIGLRGLGVPPATILSHGWRGAFEEGAHVGGWIYDGPSLMTDLEMQVYAEATITVQGAQGTVFDGVVIPRYLRSLISFIEREIFDRIEAIP